MKSSSLAIAVLAALVPTFGASACGAAETTTEPSSQSGRLLSYREEGGIGGPRPSLAVSKQAPGDPVAGRLPHRFRPRHSALAEAARRAEGRRPRFYRG